ncbi:hydrogenase nickel incorporation protein HypB [Halobaculum sp. MBLA0143]|uniref:hydrogenase nickel incorporation protein HypB n=1 Tax=Halobaculum sp. MBLA0143 TaxID=3079933 RepID=UPI003525641F
MYSSTHRPTHSPKHATPGSLAGAVADRARRLLARVTDGVDGGVSRVAEVIDGRVADSLVGAPAPGPSSAHRFGHGDDTDGEATDTEADVLAAVRDRARENHERLAHDADVFAVELLGATGSGKTALIEWLLEHAHDGDRVGVVTGDVSGEDDAERLRRHGVPVVNVTTGKDCHLDPRRVADALDDERLELDALDALYVENVGNVVCPADFPLGTAVRLAVVSPTEGTDVVRKHPHLFQVADAVAINKTDLAEAVGADTDRMVADARRIAPDAPVVETSVETEAGLGDLVDSLGGFRAADYDDGGHAHTDDSDHAHADGHTHHDDGGAPDHSDETPDDGPEVRRADHATDGGER